MKYVIIGNSAAGIGAIEAIREVDLESEITVISDESHLAYSRPLISELLADKTTQKKMLYRSPEFYELNSVELMLGRKVVGLELDSKQFILEDRTVGSYDKLLIATGSRPFIPPMEGTELNGVHTFFTLEDALAVMELARRVDNVVVVGGGLIGLKAAEGLKEREIKVTIVELAPIIMGTALDEAAAKIIERHIRSAGVEVITGNAVQTINGVNSYVASVTLKDGINIPCEMVIVAVGVRPNAEFATEAGIEVNRGIIVDNKMQTNVPDVYAAGDVAEGYDMLNKMVRGLPLWPVAYQMGKAAGFNIAGIDYEYDGGYAMNSIELFGLPTISMGITQPPEEPEKNDYQVFVKSDMEEKIYRKLVLRENRIVGAVFVNSVDRAGIINGFIKDQTDVSEIAEELLNDDFSLALMPENWRKRKLLKG